MEQTASQQYAVVEPEAMAGEPDAGAAARGMTGERLRRLVEATKAVPWEASAETWQFTYVGPQAVELLGYPVEQWYTKDFWVSALHADDREGTIALCLQSAARLRDYELEYRMMAVDGRAVWIHDIVNVVAENGRPKILQGYMIDVTSRRNAEAAVRCVEQEHLAFERLLADLSARFVNIPPERVDAEIDQGLRQILEFFRVDRCGLLRGAPDKTTFQITHAHLAEGIPPVPLRVDLPTTLFPWAYRKVIIDHEVLAVASLDEMPPEAAADVATYRAWGILSHLNIPIVVSGSDDYIISINSVRGEHAWPEEYIPRFRLLGEIFVNALERRRAEGVLRESEARFRQLADASPVMIWMSGPDKGCTYLNKGWIEFTGRPLEQELGDGWAEGVHPDDLQRCLGTYVQAFDAREQFSMEYRLRRRDGEYRWIWDVGVPRFATGGRFEGYIGSCSDITERRRMEEQLQARLAEIEDLKRRLEEENVYLREEMRLEQGHDDIVGQSDVMKRVLAQAEQVAQTDSTVLILGETGTGKELLAREIHNASARRHRTLVTVNCASLPATLIESELFGRERGAYTGALTRMAGRFEVADGSTLFLDEIGDLPLEVQAKLLRVLQEGQLERLGSTKTLQVNVRVIAATNRDLGREVKDGKFRMDLFYRLNVFPITIPPLRERAEDIPLLAWKFVSEFEKKMGNRIENIPKRTMDALQHYPWPGNARELRNAIERAMIICKGKTLDVPMPAMTPTEPVAPRNLEDLERGHILGVLEKATWRLAGRGGAAEILGLKRTTLQSRMRKLGIKRPTT
jgi:PAS domain S-box-containing protein